MNKNHVLYIHVKHTHTHARTHAHMFSVETQSNLCNLLHSTYCEAHILMDHTQFREYENVWVHILLFFKRSLLHAAIQLQY